MITKDTRKNIIQTYVLTSARFNFSKIEKQILLMIVEGLQHVIVKNLNIQNKNQMIEGMDMRMIKNDNSLQVLLKLDRSIGNTTKIVEACTSLIDKTISWSETEGKTKKTFLRKVVEQADIQNVDGQNYVRLQIANEVHDALFSFAHGFRKFDAGISYQLKTQYSMRLYELFSHLSNPITYSIEKLREITDCTEKYKTSNNNFVTKVIETAKKELDENAPYTFDYELEKDKYTKIINIKFFPKKNPNIKDVASINEATRTQEIYEIVPMSVRDFLHEKYGFTDQELKNNAPTLTVLSELYTPLEIIELINSNRTNIDKATNPKGYIFALLSKHI